MRDRHDHSFTGDGRTYLSGILMGAADIVPGVSGGTVALLLGIYQRLLNAIAGIGPKFVVAFATGRWREAATIIDLRFLLALAAGIATGIIALAHLLDALLADHTELTMAVFFGLIAASGILVARLVNAQPGYQTTLCYALGVAAAVFAAYIVTTDAVAPRLGYGYIFVCGAIAICAMILPGISGAYILLLLGMYQQITHTLKEFVSRLLHGEFMSDMAITIVVFVAGCATGLILFSRFLKWLLATAPSKTMAVLAGFMMGSLVKVWPFQNSALDEPAQPIAPTALDSHTFACLGLAIGAGALVLVVDWLARRR